MKNHNILCVIIALTLLVAVFVPVTALAVSSDYYFTFDYPDLDNHTESMHQKDDTDQLWVVTLYNTASSNMSSTNILGLKMNRSGNNNVDRYHTFSNYVTKYGIPYLNPVSATDWMYLGLKKDDASTSTAKLYVTGAYNP